MKGLVRGPLSVIGLGSCPPFKSCPESHRNERPKVLVALDAASVRVSKGLTFYTFPVNEKLVILHSH